MDCCGPVAEAHAATFTLLAALGVGLTTSLGHCLGMCGPLISTFSLAQGKADSRLRKLLPGLLLYHLGRLNSYALIGAVFSLLMAVTQSAGPSAQLRAGIFGLAGTLMVVMGLGLGGWLPTGRLLQSHRLGKAIAERFLALAGTQSMAGRYFLGVANGFLPCGPVYAMAAASLTAPTPLHGAGTMAVFGLGTVPVLLAVGLGAGRLAPALQRRFNLGAALLVVFMGVEFLLRAGKLLGLVREIRWGFVPIF
jgi:sulfite exporter TauE/SafE